MRPELVLNLYEADLSFTLHVGNCEDSDFAELKELFDHKVRLSTCHINLSQDVPLVGSPVDTADDYEAELWLNGLPLNVVAFNDLLYLAEPNLPEGWLDFNHETDVWEFRIAEPLTEAEKERVQKAAIRIGVTENVRFVKVSPPTPSASEVKTVPQQRKGLALVTSRNLRGVSARIKNLAQRDEDEWRSFLARRANQDILEPEPVKPGFACLYDAEQCGDSRLSELLTIYDRIDLMPGTNNLDWALKHQVSLADMQELVKLKRLRMVLPHSVQEYPPNLVDAIAEADPSSIVLSRALAAKTIVRGQAKEPLLYAPLTSSQRAMILSIMSHHQTESKYQRLMGSYGKLLFGQHNAFMMRGALASLGFGVGTYLGDLFFELTSQDARLELMTCGAGVEWALGLGASYIPCCYGNYDETSNSQIVASYLGRTNTRPTDPVANRMHIISDGLLGLSGIPPLEVARNFQSLSASRFRNLSRRLMEATPSESELRIAVNEINADVKAFERRAERLARWKIYVPLAGAASVGLDVMLGSAAASVGAAWIYELLEHKIPSKIRAEFGFAGEMLAALAMGTSLDAVIVSRSRKVIRG